MCRIAEPRTTAAPQDEFIFFVDPTPFQIAHLWCKTFGNSFARSSAVTTVGKWDGFLFIVLPVIKFQLHMPTPGEITFVLMWFDWAVSHGNSAQNCKPSFDWTILCGKSAVIGENCELSHNVCGLVDFTLNYAIAESWKDWKIYRIMQLRFGRMSACYNSGVWLLKPSELKVLPFKMSHLHNNTAGL